MGDIFRETLKKREEEAGLRDVRAEKKTPEAVGMTQSQFSKADKEDPRKKNQDQKRKLLEKRGK